MQATREQKGNTWDKAIAQARVELDQDQPNAWDLMTAFTGTYVPIQWAIQAARGNAKDIGLLPSTRIIQNVTGAMGLNNGKGYNIEAPLRRALQLPEEPDANTSKINQMIANMAGGGEISAQEARDTITNRTGTIFEEAAQRTSQANLVRQLGGNFALDFFPEGEENLREIRQEYDAAIASRNAGDTKGLTKFYEAYPQYAAQQAAWKKDSDSILRRYLITEVFDKYMALQGVNKQEANQQFGKIFQDAFLNKDTRDYDSIKTETLTLWSQQLKGWAPQDAGAPQTQLNLTDAKMAKMTQDYSDTRDKMFSDYKGYMQGLPEDADSETFMDYYKKYQQYDGFQRWKNKYLAEHPEIIPYVVKENSTLFGVDPKIIQGVFQYRTDRDTQFSGVAKKMSMLYAFTSQNQQEKFRKVNPDIAKFETWQAEYFVKHPEIIEHSIGELNKLKGLPMDVQAAVYKYKYTVSTQLPGVYDKQDAYFKITDPVEKKAYLLDNPDLTGFWTWKKQYMAVNQKAAPYIANLEDEILGKSQYGVTPEKLTEVMSTASTMLQSQLMQFVYAKQPLSTGAVMELERLLDENNVKISATEFIQQLTGGEG
jgi:hypothetical protein